MYVYMYTVLTCRFAMYAMNRPIFRGRSRGEVALVGVQGSTNAKLC